MVETHQKQVKGEATNMRQKMRQYHAPMRWCGVPGHAKSCQAYHEDTASCIKRNPGKHARGLHVSFLPFVPHTLNTPFQVRQSVRP